ncbi:MAG: DUF2934 domain-containing protein [Magnetospirillum sp.]|nr:DUF2934 domain-containing protein [Magnetospirillum sp.]
MSVAIPVRLTLAESGAVALAEAARRLNNADNTSKFLSALDDNHRLWMTLAEVARTAAWAVPDRRLAHYVMATSCKAGCGVHDGDVEALIDINRDVSARLVRGRSIDSIRRRAELAWRESGRTGATLERWLIQEIARKAHLH